MNTWLMLLQVLVNKHHANSISGYLTLTPTCYFLNKHMMSGLNTLFSNWNVTAVKTLTLDLKVDYRHSVHTHGGTHVCPCMCVLVNYSLISLQITYKTGSVSLSTLTIKQTSPKNAEQKKCNLSHFKLADHSLIHLSKYLFINFHMADTALHVRGYIGK